MIGIIRNLIERKNNDVCIGTVLARHLPSNFSKMVLLLCMSKDLSWSSFLLLHVVLADKELNNLFIVYFPIDFYSLD